jgi:hypothetical protein
MKVFGTICAYCLVVFALPGVVAAQNYTFTNIVDNTGPFAGFAFPKLNNAGGISFQASLDAGSSGIYRSDGADITTIADGTGPHFGFGSATDINDAGQIAFTAHQAFGGRGLFRGDGLTVTKIADQFNLSFDPNYLVFTSPAINNTGTVAFYAYQNISGDRTEGIFVGSGGNTTNIAYDHEEGSLPFFSDPEINDLGAIAFFRSFLGGGNGIYRSNGGAIATIIDSTGPYNSYSQTIDINSNGVVVAAGASPTAHWDVLRIDGPNVDIIAPSVDLLSHVGINNAGDVGFFSRLTINQNVILTGPDPVADKVIADGDPLFGSTVELSSPDGPNDAGQFTFGYSLADGRSGIALATPVADPMCIGDYNGDGKVSAADYTVWRDSIGATTLLNRHPENDGPVGGDDFNSWMAHYGEAGGSGSGNIGFPSASVPEPATLTLVLLAVCALITSAHWRK